MQLKNGVLSVDGVFRRTKEGYALTVKPISQTIKLRTKSGNRFIS